MKKSVQLLVFSAFLIGLIANAQSSSNDKNKIKGNGKVVTETRNTGDYDAIKVGGPFDVNLVAGKEGKITIKGEENLLAVIKVEVEDNALKIYVDKTANIRPSSGHEIEITVPFEKISAVIIIVRQKIIHIEFTGRTAGAHVKNTFNFLGGPRFIEKIK